VVFTKGESLYLSSRNPKRVSQKRRESWRPLYLWGPQGLCFLKDLPYGKISFPHKGCIRRSLDRQACTSN